jgi:hypothetical protein
VLLAASRGRAQLPAGHRVELALQSLEEHVVLAHHRRREALGCRLILVEWGLLEEVGHHRTLLEIRLR